IYSDDDARVVAEDMILPRFVDTDTGKIVHTWSNMLTSASLNKVMAAHPRVTLLKHHLNFAGQLKFGRKGSDQCWATFGDYPYAEVEVELERGAEGQAFVTKVNILKDDGNFEEKIFAQLVDPISGEILRSWHYALRADPLRDIIRKHPMIILKNGFTSSDGTVCFGSAKGDNVWTKIGGFENRFFDAVVERGIDDMPFVTSVKLYSEGQMSGGVVEKEEMFIKLCEPDTGKIVHSWRGGLKVERFSALLRRHGKLVVKDRRLDKNGFLYFGRNQHWAQFRSYPGRLVEADVEAGYDDEPFIARVRIYRENMEDGIETEEEFSKLIDAETGKIVHSWWATLPENTLDRLVARHPKLILSDFRLNSAGHAKFGNIDFTMYRYAGYQIEAEIERGKVTLARLVWSDGSRNYKSRAGPGYGRVARRLFPKEEDFRDELALRLDEEGFPLEMGQDAATTLILLCKDSLELLVEHSLVDERTARAIVSLDISNIDIKDLAGRLNDAVSSYRRLGASDEEVNRILRSYLLPPSFIEYLQRKYRLGRSISSFMSAPRVHDIELYIRRRRDSVDERGKLDRRRHLALYEPNMAYILSAGERAELLEKFKRQAAMLDALSMKEPLNIRYEIVSNTGNEYKLKLLETGPAIRQGDVICVADMPSILRVNRVEGRIIEVADESGSEESLQSSGVLVHTPRDVTYDIQKSALQKIIKSMESNGCRTTGFAIIDHMLGLSADIARTPGGFLDSVVSFYDNKIVRRQSRDEEGLESWSGDESQEAAVKLALSPSKLKIVHGPPGTGKTVVIAEMIRQYARQGKKVLLVSQMNQALDNALQMVMNDVPALRLGNDIEPLRKYGTDKIWIHDPEAVSRFELKKGRSGGFVFAATDVGVVSDNAGLRRVGEKGFDVVIMDESSRETFAGALVPLQYLRDDGQCILVGDTKQLEPFMSLDEIDVLTESGFAAEEIESFGRSVLASIEGGGIADEVMLSTNWRSRPLITGLFSELFYDGDIHRRGWEDFTPDTLSLKIIDTDNPEGQYYEEPVGTSYQNTRSAREVMSLIDYYLRNKGVPMEKITVITALKPQADLIRNLVRSEYGADMPHITTIDSYQGGENDTVIIDFVRSNPHGAIGFIKDLHRLNVALSRAKENMAIVWDSRVFMRDPDSISREDAPARDIFRKMREYYIKEVAQFFPDEYPTLVHAPLPRRRPSATYLGMNLFIPRSWIRPDGGLDWAAIRASFKSVSSVIASPHTFLRKREWG
ncbi:MAG: AAA family ATPase, partial [Candidatus Omnitrophica bacterium]|nr:AAA family ATPase [Candidatus Omnitrophota bacterium]